MNVQNSFQKNADGSWTSVASVTIKGPNGEIQIRPGMTFRKGVLFMGVDLSDWLDKN